jgi:plasmid maintenance system antidote protein VapI
LRAMSTSPLTVLRLAHPGDLSLRQLAKKIGISPNAGSLFETGRQRLSDEKLRAWAKALGAKPAEVQKRWLQTAYMHHAMRLREIRSALGKRGKKPVPGARPKALEAAR